jgi:hypothetical protein
MQANFAASQTSNSHPHRRLGLPFTPTTRSQHLVSFGMAYREHWKHAIRSEVAMTTRTLMMALLVTFVLGAGVAFRSHEDALNVLVVRQLSDQLAQTKSELIDATLRLSEAHKKLGFLESSKARVQVTAYALTDDFGPNPVFSNNAPARNAYAVPKHTLPAEKILNVALSPTAERKLHANLNDTIVLMSRNRARKHLARFVDRTAQTETRSVVDILFADAHEARIWGWRSFYAVNISRPDSPFQQ